MFSRTGDIILTIRIKIWKYERLEVQHAVSYRLTFSYVLLWVSEGLVHASGGLDLL